MQKFLIFLLLTFSIPASALNTMPNCGGVPGTSMPNVDVTTLPAPVFGISSQLIGPAAGNIKVNANNTGQARFNIGFPVAYSQNDPIVFPNMQNVTHTHVFWGNTAVGLQSRTNLLTLQTNCLSKANGGTANCSGYWEPAMVDTSNNTIVPASDLRAYYKSGIVSVFTQPVTAPPLGLRMISGSSSNTVELTSTNNTSMIRFSCHLANGTYTEKFVQHIPDCPQGSTIETFLEFPSCWDGVNLDSTDHKSHMAFMGTSVCPASHPIRIPQIAYNVDYEVTAATGTSTWRLSSDNYATNGFNAGYSFHADWVNGWDQTIISTFVNSCLNQALDCLTYNISTQQRLLPVN